MNSTRVLRPTQLHEWQLVDGHWKDVPGGLQHFPTSATGESTDIARGHILFPLPERGCRLIQFSADARSPKPLGMFLLLDESYLGFGSQAGGQAILVIHAHVRAYDPDALVVSNKIHRLLVVGDEQKVRWYADDNLLFESPRDRAEPFRQVGLRTWGNTTFTNIQVEISEVVPAPTVRPAEKFVVSTAVDFIDDLRVAPFTRGMFDQYMHHLRDIGVRRVYWQDDIGPLRPNFWCDPLLQAALDKQAKAGKERGMTNYRRTILEVKDLLQTAVEAGHAAGLEVYGGFKFFDMFSYEPQEQDNFRVWPHFMWKHSDKLLQRRPMDTLPGQPIGAIRLVKDNARTEGLKAEQVQVWISDDNQSYRRYDGPMRITERVEMRAFPQWWGNGCEASRSVRVLAFENLQIRAKHVYLSTPMDGTGDTFRNQLYRLIEAFTPDGQPIPFSYGTQRGAGSGPPPSAGDWALKIPFGWMGGTPTGATSGLDGVEQIWAVDNESGGVAISREIRCHAGHAWCPAYPEVRQFFQQCVNGFLDAGVEGLDLRIASHNRIYDWREYGFNPPVVEEYRRRYGTDITKEPFDLEKRQRLLGEHWTQFVRDASQLVRARGRKMQAHIEGGMDEPPSRYNKLGIHWDWRTWLGEDLLDEITLKEVFPGTNFFDEIMELARKQNVRAYFSPAIFPYLKAPWKGTQGSCGGLQTVRTFLQSGRSAGLDGYILYEGATFLAGSQDGRVDLLFPQLKDLIAEVAA